MCPACIATVALIVAGASSTGGAAALFMKFRMKRESITNCLWDKLCQTRKGWAGHDENDIVKLNCAKVMTNCRGRHAEMFQVRTESEHDGASPANSDCSGPRNWNGPDLAVEEWIPISN
jgi:hypothetical protein